MHYMELGGAERALLERRLCALLLLLLLEGRLREDRAAAKQVACGRLRDGLLRLEARRDDGDADGIAHRLVDVGTEDDVRIW